jgi:hypothetical protein
MASPWFDPLLFAIICLGGGGLLLSLWLGLALDYSARASRWIHAAPAVTALAASVFAVVAVVAGQPLPLWGSAGILALLCLIAIVLQTPSWETRIGAAMRLARRPLARRFTMVGLWAFCPFVALGLVYSHVYQDTDADCAFFESQSLIVVREPIEYANSPLTTDLGHTVRLLQVEDVPPVPTSPMLDAQARLLQRFDLNDDVIALPLGWQNTNCHGFVFTGGRYWVGGGQVDMILADNGYRPAAAAQTGDLAIYRDDLGTVLHSGIVCGLASDGVILVESKWGQSGRFIHRHDRHPFPTTAECIFYRSARQGHLLRGLYSLPDNQSAVPPGSRPSPMSSAPVGGAPVGL